MQHQGKEIRLLPSALPNPRYVLDGPENEQLSPLIWLRIDLDELCLLSVHPSSLSDFALDNLTTDTSEEHTVLTNMADLEKHGTPCPSMVNEESKMACYDSVRFGSYLLLWCRG